MGSQSVARRRTVLACAALAVALGGCASDDEPNLGGVVVSQPDTTTPTSDRSSEPPSEPPSDPPADLAPPPSPRVAGTVATGLTSPWDVVFLPDGDALLSERDTGLVKRITESGDVDTVGEISASEPSSEGGLLGLAVHPDYPEQPYLYAYYSTDTDNRVVRLRYAPGESFGPEELLIDGIPSSEIHNGGRIAFGPDGMLYVATGDGSTGEVSQDRSSLGGKILRLTPEGDPAPDNPFGGSPVWTYGHRNVQGIDWDDAGNLYASEFGQDTWDELNLIEQGSNYGWPKVEGASDRDKIFTDPLVQWRPDEASPSAVAYADGAVWMVGLAGERLWRITVTDGQVIGQPEAFFTSEYGRLREVEAAPDGSLWLVTSNTDGRGTPAPDDDRILRLELR
ncbi:MAG: PQQ-dependent sugar dehydrogenase [Actinomycetota bacterium]|nr:PQQ-dependent sugar dehydrogenase [Actinomycetota bacterium]